MAAAVVQLQSCVLRPWRDGDVPSLVLHANDREVWRNLRDRFPHPYTEADARGWIELTGDHPPDTNFAIEVAGEAVGGIGLVLGEDVHRRTAEIGYWLGRRHWGHGIVTEAVTAVSRIGFERHGLDRIHAPVFEWNPASMRVLEKAGYALEGRLRRAAVKDGQVIDMLLYALVRD